jgi:hypothetical protein
LEFQRRRLVHQGLRGAGLQDVALPGAVPWAPDPDAERRDAAETGLEAQNQDAAARRGAVALRPLPDACLAVRLAPEDGFAVVVLGEAAAFELAVRLPDEVEQFPDAAEQRQDAELVGRTAEQSQQVRRLQGAAEREPSDALQRQPEAEPLVAASLAPRASEQSSALEPVQPVAQR